MKKLLFIALVLIASSATAQDDNLFTYDKDYTSISLGAGLMRYYGELPLTANDKIIPSLKPAYTLRIKKRFKNSLGVALGATHGEMHLYTGINDPYNFKSQITQGDLSVVYHLDDGNIINRGANISPYISAGVGYFTFDPKADLYDANGMLYHFWSDGTIRDMEETEANELTASLLERDRKYESDIVDSVSYDESGIAIPIEAGVTLKLGNLVYATLFYRYNFTNVDHLEGYSIDSKNDAYSYAGATLTYNFGAKTSTKRDWENYGDIDFKKFETEDTDGDGVPDFDDWCQETEGGTEVDSHGCPKVKKEEAPVEEETPVKEDKPKEIRSKVGDDGN